MMVTCEQHCFLGTVSTIKRYSKYITHLIRYTSKTEVDCIVPLSKLTGCEATYVMRRHRGTYRTRAALAEIDDLITGYFDQDYIYREICAF